MTRNDSQPIQIEYSHGQAFGPGGPWGEHVLVLDTRGHGSLQSKSGSRLRRWQYRVDASVVSAILEALRSAGFPTAVPEPLAALRPDTPPSRILLREGQSETRATLDGLDLPGFREAQRWLQGIIAAIFQGPWKGKASVEKVTILQLDTQNNAADGATIEPDQRPLRERWFEAAKRGDLPRLQRLLAEGAAINAVDHHGNTALFYAVAPFGGIPELVEWLVESGANVNARNRSGENAVEYGHAGVSAAGELMTMKSIEQYLRSKGFDD